MSDSENDIKNVAESIKDKIYQIPAQPNKLIYAVAAVAGGITAWFVLWIIGAIVASSGDVLKLSKGQRYVQLLFETLAWIALIVVPIIVYKLASKPRNQI